ncbi:MAG: NAD+ synthase [Candidatus Omnitrophica bacterium]|nr:NAD+ synthase [Candidatus Omnitrophota bacterium]MCF7887722.1 NAD+ synthase [Candidatus Omnitrophota bacterium]
MIKIALAQINPTVGDLRGNAQKIAEFIKKAKKSGANFIVFPELALTGYPPEDLLLKNYFIKENIKILNKIKKETSGITVIVGFVDKNKLKTYNSCAIIQDKKIIDTYHKIYLPNHGIFDEKRYFSSGKTLPIYEFNNKKFTVTICEDLWIKKHQFNLKNKNLDFIINISASPFSIKKIKQRKKVISSTAKITKSFIFYCNLVGGQDEIIFDGRSLIYSPKGKLLKEAKKFSTDIIYFNLERPKQKSIQTQSNKIENIYSALSLGIKDYMRKNKFQKAILGLSGGLDSAVTLAIVAKSIGSNKVNALIMPSFYSSKKSLTDAIKICKNLKIKYYTVTINDIFDCFNRDLKPYFKNLPTDSTEENLQARIRGNILMAFSNKFGHLVITTGNKSEISCGYCTLYGDMAGGFGILKDVYKTSVYQLAHFINRKNKKSIIPKSIINKAPSAELRPNQKDTDNLPQYSLLDKILHLYIENDIDFQGIVKKGFDRKIVKKIIEMVDSSEYKRRQSPIGIKISEKAFGKDRRMPITNNFKG